MSSEITSPDATPSVASQLIRQMRARPLYGVVFLAAIGWFLATLLLGFAQQRVQEKRLPPIGLDYLEQGDRDYRQGRIEAALAQYRIATAIAPDDDAGLLKRAAAAWETGYPDEAKRAVSQALWLNPRLARGHYLLGLIHLDEGDLNAAIRRNRAAIVLEPGYAPAHNNLGLALLRQGDRTGAQAQFEKALALDPALNAARANLQALEGS